MGKHSLDKVRMGTGGTCADAEVACRFRPRQVGNDVHVEVRNYEPK